MQMHGSERGRDTLAARPMPRSSVRDVEDAEFEVISQPGDVFNSRSTDAPSGSVFKSRLMETTAGPVPPDFPFRGDATVADRPAFFERRATAGGLPLSAPAFAGFIAVAVLFVFWMAGGHALVFGSNKQPDDALRATALPGRGLPQAQSLPRSSGNDAQQTVSHEKTGSVTANVEILRPQPQAARIERAGSIFMIRSSGE